MMSDMAAVAAKHRETSKRPASKPVPAMQTGIGNLTADEVKQARSFFRNFDRDQNGLVDHWELFLAMQAMGKNPTREEVNTLMNRLDTNGDEQLDVKEFLTALSIQKKNERKEDADEHLVQAFVAMGGNADKTGSINAENLRRVMKEDFGLQIKVDELLDDLDSSGDGSVQFDEFAQLLT